MDASDHQRRHRPVRLVCRVVRDAGRADRHGPGRAVVDDVDEAGGADRNAIGLLDRDGLDQRCRQAADGHVVLQGDVPPRRVRRATDGVGERRLRGDDHDRRLERGRVVRDRDLLRIEVATGELGWLGRASTTTRDRRSTRGSDRPTRRRHRSLSGARTAAARPSARASAVAAGSGRGWASVSVWVSESGSASGLGSASRWAMRSARGLPARSAPPMLRRPIPVARGLPGCFRSGRSGGGSGHADPRGRRPRVPTGTRFPAP